MNKHIPFPLGNDVEELVTNMSCEECGSIVKLYCRLVDEYVGMTDMQRQLIKALVECLFEHFDEANRQEDQ